MTDLLMVWGTRPEAIKLGPVAAELTALGVNWGAVATGQHTSLLAGTPAATDLAQSESLAMPSDGNVPRWLTVVQDKLTSLIDERQPNLIVVQGDTMSAHVGAMTARVLGVPLAHIEAGVRSHDLSDPWPEEVTRVEIAKIARWHYAPTSTAFGNLVAEGVPTEHIRLTGNTAVSALAKYLGDLHALAAPDDTVLVTLHRRAIQVGPKANLLYGAIRHEALMHPRVRFIWPIHPGLAKVVKRLAEPANLALSNPIDYCRFMLLLSEARGVITDSGGLVEEATTLGVPTIILRHRNDRPEAIEAGVAAQCEPDMLGVARGVRLLLDGSLTRAPSSAFGDASAAKAIAQHLATVVETT